MQAIQFEDFCRLFVLASFVVSSSFAEEYQIVTTWDNRTINHTPVIIRLERNDASSFKISVDAPFFNDPAPPGQAGEPYYGLWEFEVVEVFFLNDHDQYVEIELCPWGQHIVLLLNGYRKTIRHSLFIDFEAFRASNNQSWQGVAIIPATFLPPNVTKMNAYAIHGVDEKRVYESLYPVPYNSESGPNFHKLDAFKSFNRSIILNEDVGHTLSQIWEDSFEGIRSLKIENTWNGLLLEEGETVDLQLEARSGTGLIVKVVAPFYNDVPPSDLSGWPSSSLSSNEVVHVFLRSDNNRYLEIELGPWGHYLVVFWTGNQNNVSDWRDEIVYQVERQNDSRWRGTAFIPLTYLPPMVSKCNAHSAHGPEGDQRKINSLYPNASNLDFHDKNNYKAIDMSMIYAGNENATCSNLWANRDSSCPQQANAGSKEDFSLLLMVIMASISAFLIVD